MPPLFLISGPPGAGKSSVSRTLMGHFSFGVHLPLDDLREFVVSGMAHPGPTWDPEFGRQYALSLEGGIRLATLYSDAGFAVAIDNVVDSSSAHRFDIAFAGRPFFKVLLLPTLEAALERNRTRTNKTFDTALLEPIIERIHREHAAQTLEQSWLVLDSTALSLEQTVAQILTWSRALESG